MKTTETAVLKITNLSKSYGDKKVLDDISFSVEQGEIVGFLGPNGAGKSTTMNIITGYLAPTQGEVFVAGINISENPEGAKRHIGYLPESPPLYNDMTVAEYLSFAYDLKKCKMDKNSHIQECMELVKITHTSNRLIKNLSKGYKQRVGLCQALLGEPDILILDEPTAGMDPAQIMEIRDLILSLGKKKSVIISTHILQEVTAICDKVVIINGGKIKASDTIKNLESNGFTYIIKASADAGELLCSAGFSYEELEENSEKTYRIFAEKDARADIFNAFCQGNITLLELRDDTRSIEDIFTEYTSLKEDE